MVGAMFLGAWLLIQQQCCNGEPSQDMRLRSSMIDPLIRRSPLEKNFMRFGRSWNPTEEPCLDREDDLPKLSTGQQFPPEKDTDYRSKGPISKQEIKLPSPLALYWPERTDDQFSRVAKDKENFIRFGKSSSDSKDITYLSDQINRLSRANDNFMRFGRGKDNFLRFGRGKDNFLRFGKGKDSFMRFGRGKQENFIRFGRGKQDFIRFGRDSAQMDDMLENMDMAKMRFGRSAVNNFMRFGRDGQNGLEFLRWTRDPKGAGFIRFGRDKNLVRMGRQRQSDKGDGFIRFGRSMKEHNDSQDDTDENQNSKSGKEFRVKRSAYDLFVNDGENLRMSDDKTLPGDGKDLNSNEMPYSNVKGIVPGCLGGEKNCFNGFNAQLLSALCSSLQQQPSFYGPLPNFMIGPGLNFLPNLDTETKRAKSNSRNFIRLG
jgi:hypothetical protein